MNWITVWTAAAAFAGWTSIIAMVFGYVFRGTIKNINLTIENTVKDAVDDAVIRINGTYMRAAGTDVTGAELVRRVERLEEKE